jgi:16S rRNA processing protein RimM
LGFCHVETREAAEALRDYVLEIRSSQLPELENDEFYPFDLVGLEVRDGGGTVIGRVTDVMDSPAHALLQVSRASETAGVTSEDLVPFVRAAVPVVALAEGYLEVAPGFLPEYGAPGGGQPQGGLSRVDTPGTEVGGADGADALPR